MHLAAGMSRTTRPRRGRPQLLVAGVALLVGLSTEPGSGQPRPGANLEKATLELVADRTAYQPGSRLRVAGLVTIEPGWHVQSHTPTYDYLIPTELRLEAPDGWPEATVAYPAHILWKAAFEEEELAVYEGQIRIMAELRVPQGFGEERALLRGHLRYQACDENKCLPPTTAEAEVGVGIGPGGEAQHGELFTNEDETPATSAGARLPWMLLLALLGGFILNAMPCVLPVLSLKTFSLIKSASQGRTETVVGSLSTAAGILFSFWALALAAVVARGAGKLVGWGIQFQNPGFVTFLTIVVVLFCLNLWGLFEIPLPRRLAMVADSGARQGIPGHLTSGLFATLMATPCSAPFLGTAVGFALSQEAPTIFAIFTAVGVGMAVPYLLLAASPGVARLLPKPGPWMEQLKGIMAFLLAGAAIWLLYVLAAQVRAERLALIELGLLLMALFIWLHRRRANRGRLRWGTATGILAAIFLTMTLSLQGADDVAARSLDTQGLISWTEFDRQRAESLASQGRLVFVDVTADWCFTCKVNERLVLETHEVAEVFERYGVVAMKADWTNRDDEISAYLAEFGRYGIPFYLLYRPGREPHLFSELLSKGEVVSALEDAGWEMARKQGGNEAVGQ